MKSLAALTFAVLATGCATPGANSRALSEREALQLEMQQGRSVQAIERIERLAAQNRDDLVVARMLAEAHVQAGSAPKLLARLRESNDAVAHYVKGLLLFSRAADAIGPATSEFQQAISLRPNEGEFHYRLGVALVEAEKYEQALGPLREATRLEPSRPSWYLPLAKALARTGARAEAIEAVRSVVRADSSPTDVKIAAALMDQITDPFAMLPQSARPRLERALQWLETADVPQEAIVLLEELAQESPDQGGLHSLLGLAYERLDDAGRAVDEFQRAIELAPFDGKNHLYLAQVYSSHQRAKMAEEQLRKAVELNPVLAEAWFKLGDLALERNDSVSARTNFIVAARLEPQSTAARGKLALVYQLEQNWPAAIRELRAVLDRDPENVEFMLRLGVLHTERFTRGKSRDERESAAKEATQWLEKVLALQPENALASRALERLKQR